MLYRNIGLPRYALTKPPCSYRWKSRFEKNSVICRLFAVFENHYLSRYYILRPCYYKSRSPYIISKNIIIQKNIALVYSESFYVIVVIMRYHNNFDTYSHDLIKKILLEFKFCFLLLEK